MKDLEVALGLFAIGALTGAGAAALTWGYVAGKPVQLRLVQVGTDDKGRALLLRFDAADAWKAMAAAAAAAGVALVLNSAFRTYEQQQALRALYDAGQGAMAAEPGYSDHQGGVAVDVESAGGSNAAFYWMSGNAARFGFKRTVASEPWHWEFV